MERDPYEVLGVSPGASKDEIKKAYRKMAKRCWCKLFLRQIRVRR